MATLAQSISPYSSSIQSGASVDTNEETSLLSRVNSYAIPIIITTTWIAFCIAANVAMDLACLGLALIVLATICTNLYKNFVNSRPSANADSSSATSESGLSSASSESIVSTGASSSAESDEPLALHNFPEHLQQLAYAAAKSAKNNAEPTP